MSCQPIDFLDTARQMCVSSGEIHYRNCISRAYYYAYHKVVPFAEDFEALGRSTDKVGVHERVIQRLTGRGNPQPVRAIGHNLRSLKRLRTIADYQLHRSLNEEQARKAIDMATQITTMLAQVHVPTPAARPRRP